MVVQPSNLKPELSKLVTGAAIKGWIDKEIKERIKLDIKAVGTIKVDEIYAVAPPQAGKKIA